MAFAGIALIKEQSRRALHSAQAVSAVYRRGDDTLAEALRVRWHNKLLRQGALQGGFDAEIIEGINRLVFQQPDLDAKGIEPAHDDVVEIAFPGGTSATFSLDTSEPSDGPLNVYWNVCRL